MATNLVYNNTSTQVPGAYSSVDASGLATVGLGATGIVAIIGEAQGGKPYTEIAGIADFTRLSSPSAISQNYQSGDLVEAINMAFAPSSDTTIAGGAQSVVAMKVNPSTGSSAVFANAHGPVMRVTSLDHGTTTTQINVSIAPGSEYGQMLTIAYQDIIETADNLGGPLNFKLQYRPGGADPKLASWQAMGAGVQADGSIYANGSLTQVGLATDVASANGAAAPATVTWGTADAGTQLTIYGLDGTGNALRETLVLGVSGGTQNTANSFAQIAGAALLQAAANGSITVALRGNQVLAFTAGSRGRGAAVFTNTFVAGQPVTVSNPSNAPITVIVDGLTAQGSPVAEALNIPGGGTQVTSNSLSALVALAAGNVSAGVQIAVSAQAALYSSAQGATLSAAETYFNALSTTTGEELYGFVATGDYTTAKVLLSSLDATTQSQDILIAKPLTSGLNALVNWINVNSQLVSASIIPGAQGAPSLTPRPTYLGGGGEGVATFADYQKCLNLLKQINVNSVVCLTSDPAVNAALDAHCTFMCGAGKKERDGFAGLMNQAQNDVPTLKQALAQAQTLNTRNLRVFPQAVTRYNTSGALQEFPPHYMAVIAAGMQAGAAVGTSLTHKYASVISFRADPSLDPINNAEVLIGGGLMYLEHVDGRGSRWVRNVTCYLQSNNLAYTEGSVNAAANYTVYSLRTGLEDVIGLPNFSGTASGVKTICLGTLSLLVRQGVITGYLPPQVTVAGDTIAVSVQVAPVIPTNFVTLNMHLSTQSAITAASSAS
ncbi:MAG: hypothetical protein EOO40_00530 [Deltaproteobacteria bacterium]|nr:MAG: hypothetical protein EOO40_00530 [Deltaproteobacteria bacterium]